MAKKRRIVSEEAKAPEYEFVPPDFNEREFILKDIYGTKITLVVSVLAVVFGLLAGFIDYEFDWYFGLLLIVAGLFAIKHILKLIRLDTDMLVAGKDSSGSKSMLGNYFVFVFLSLAIWILLINPPFV